jgi:hypothetical protein
MMPHGTGVLMAGALAAVLLAGCGGAPQSESTSAEGPVAADVGARHSDDVERIAAIAREIEAAPDRAMDILTAHGLTAEQFQDVLYEIAADSEKSEAYARAKGANR